MPRKDQVRNRERVIAAAQTLFVEQGSRVNLDEVARRTGIGSSTLYRHFPTRDDLVDAVLDRLVIGVRKNSEGANRIVDPREAFRVVITDICDLDGSEIAAFSELAATSPRTERHARELVRDVISPATDRLRDAHGLRAGVTADDVVTFIRMVESTPSTPEQRRMALDVLIDGLIV